MMDAANYAKALKKADDPTIVETKLTKDGVEDFGYGGGRGMGGDQQQQQQNRHGQQGESQDNTAPARAPANVSWSRDSKKFAMVRRDARKVEKLWVINSLANPRPTLETYRYAMPGDVERPHRAAGSLRRRRQELAMILKADGFKDQSLQVEVDRPTAREREHERTEAAVGRAGSDKLYFTRISRDLHRVDVCVADLATGEVKPLIQERMNVYIETKPLRFIDNGSRDDLVVGARWLGPLLSLRRRRHPEEPDRQGRVRRRRYRSYVDEKARQLFMTADGREDGENPYFMHLYRANLDGSGMKLLDPGDASHAVAMSDSAKYFVDNGSRVNTAPEADAVRSRRAPS